MKRTILAIVGRDVAGKDTAGAYLEKNFGFEQVITGQLVRDYIAEHNLGEPTRELMTIVANETRDRYGSDVFIQRALKLEADKLLINGARAVGEINAIKEAGGIVVAVDAPAEKRYAWSTVRGRTSDLVSLEEFIRLEEFGSTNKSVNGVNVAAMVNLADQVVKNHDDFESFYRNLDALMVELGIEKIAGHEA